MKKLFTLLSFSALVAFSANAQYCGSSQVSAVTPTNTYGFGNLNNIACIQQGVPTTLTLPFKTYTQFDAQGNHVTIYKLRIDTMSNLPCGMCWSSNKPTNEFLPDEIGTFQIQGTTNDPVGEYKVHLMLSVNTDNGTGYNISPINADAGGIYLYFRVNGSGTCAPVDTNSLGLTASCKTAAFGVGINEVTNSVSALSVQPNPMANEAKVTFASETNGAQTLRITSIGGSEVYRATVDAKAGMNETTISKGNLPAGIYILSVGSSKGTATRKFVIAE